MFRDDSWLFSKLDFVWDQYFPDIPQENNVRIVWGRRARGRLGSIKLGEKITGKHPETIITINSLFRDVKIPEYVVLGTIAHELSHYAHGFHSPMERKYLTPHAHGVVTKELKTRGLENIYRTQKRWLKENWREYIMQAFPPKSQKRRKGRVIFRWI
jgi:hypothetical protein